MPFFFIGGEDHDFQKIGVATVDIATTAARRTSNARCSLRVGPGIAATDGWFAVFSTPLTSFWWTGRVYFSAITAFPATAYDLVAFYDGITRRLNLGVDTVANTPHLVLYKQTASGTRTALATSSNQLVIATQYKIDIQVIAYGASCTVNVYLDNVLWLTFSGNPITDSATSLSGFAVGGVANSSSSYWSEIIVSSNETRMLSLVTLPALANGNTFNWTTGTTTDLSEVTLTDATLASSATAGQIAQSTITSTGVTGNPIIQAVAISARAQKGTTGPSKADLGVRTAATDYWSADIALPVTLDRINNIWETNPNTSAPWLYTDLTNAGFNIGMKSVT